MRRAVLALGLLLLAAAPPPSSGQSLLPPDSPYRDSLVLVSVNVLTPPQDVDMLGQVRYDLQVQDLSADRAQQTGVQHTIRLEARINETTRAGWSAFLGEAFWNPSFGGSTFSSFLVVQATPTARTQFNRVTITAILQSSTGQVVTDTIEVVTRLRPYSLVTVDLRAAPANVGPFEEVQVPVTIGNVGLYPEAFLVEAEGPPGWIVTVQPRITLFPGETRDVVIHLVTPATRVFQPQETGIITVRVRSASQPEVVYERAAVVILQGAHLPEYWVPILVLGAVLAGATAKRSVEAGRRRQKEQGRPLPPKLTPAQAVLLADLKRRDPERYRELVGRQRAVFRARERAWLGVRARREQVERALVDRQHAQVRDKKAQEQEAAKETAAKEAELDRRRAELERVQSRQQRILDAQQRREERKRLAAERRQARLAAPNLRREERARRLKERHLQAELARKRRLLAVEERKRRVELDKRARLMARRKRELERRLARRRPNVKVPKPKKEKPPKRKGGGEGQEGPPAGPGP